MTALAEPVKVRTLLGPSLPQVNLLPPEVRAARGLRVLKRWLAIGLVLIVMVCAGGYWFATMTVSDAETELVQAQADTARIRVDQAKYAEVPAVLAAVDTATSARALGMSTEVEWKGYLDAIAAVLPNDVSFETFSVVGATPMTAAALPTNPLQGPSVGQITLTSRTGTLPDTAAWLDALNSIPGFANAWSSAAIITANDKATYYTVESTVQFTDAAYAHRFAAAERTK